MRQLLRMRPVTKRILIVDAGLLALALVCFLVCRALAGTLESQSAAARWAGDGGETKFAQISCFLPADAGLGLDGIYTFRQALSERLSEEGLETAYTDAWSCTASLNVSGEHGSGTAKAVAVGGNFFFFHPLRLVSGGYLFEDDPSDDRVVLDRALAWRLYGSDDIAGLTVEVAGLPFVVAGVVERDSDFASKKADGAALRLYLPDTAYRRLADAAEAVSCYELVMPEPVDGFAEAFAREKFPLGGGELICNSARFRLSGLRGVLKDFGTRSMRSGGVFYPDWENAARCVEDWCALFLALAFALAVCPAVTGAALLGIGLIRGKDYLAEKVPALAAEGLDRLRRRRWARRGGARGK